MEQLWADLTGLTHFDLKDVSYNVLVVCLKEKVYMTYVDVGTHMYINTFT